MVQEKIDVCEAKHIKNQTSSKNNWHIIFGYQVVTATSSNSQDSCTQQQNQT